MSKTLNPQSFSIKCVCVHVLMHLGISLWFCSSKTKLVHTTTTSSVVVVRLQKWPARLFHSAVVYNPYSRSDKVLTNQALNPFTLKSI